MVFLWFSSGFPMDFQLWFSPHQSIDHRENNPFEPWATWRDPLISASKRRRWTTARPLNSGRRLRWSSGSCAKWWFFMREIWGPWFHGIFDGIPRNFRWDLEWGIYNGIIIHLDVQFSHGLMKIKGSHFWPKGHHEIRATATKLVLAYRIGRSGHVAAWFCTEKMHRFSIFYSFRARNGTMPRIEADQHMHMPNMW